MDFLHRKLFKKTFILLGLAIFFSTMAIIAWEMSKGFRQTLGPAKITLINLTGDTIQNIKISMNGKLNRTIRKISNAQFIEMSLASPFSEGTPSISWEDAGGAHQAIADTYVEDSGFYHVWIVLTVENKAVVIDEAALENKP